MALYVPPHRRWAPVPLMSLVPRPTRALLDQLAVALLTGQCWSGGRARQRRAGVADPTDSRQLAEEIISLLAAPLIGSTNASPPSFPPSLSTSSQTAPPWCPTPTSLPAYTQTPLAPTEPCHSPVATSEVSTQTTPAPQPTVPTTISTSTQTCATTNQESTQTPRPGKPLIGSVRNWGCQAGSPSVEEGTDPFTPVPSLEHRPHPTLPAILTKDVPVPTSPSPPPAISTPGHPAPMSSSLPSAQPALPSLSSSLAQPPHKASLSLGKPYTFTPTLFNTHQEQGLQVDSLYAPGRDCPDTCVYISETLGLCPGDVIMWKEGVNPFKEMVALDWFVLQVVFRDGGQRTFKVEMKHHTPCAECKKIDFGVIVRKGRIVDGLFVRAKGKKGKIIVL